MFTAQWEAESIKKSYSKVVDAYGCLGILKINLGKKNQRLFLFFPGDYVLNCCISSKEYMRGTNEAIIALKNVFPFIFFI